MTDKSMFLKNYYFYGDQADMVSALTEKIDRDSGAYLFNSAVELFIMSAIVGVSLNATAKPDRNKEKRTNILAEQFNSHHRELKLVFKYVTLMGSKNEYSSVDRLNKTFRNPETDENYQQFEEYMLGGLKEIYESLILDTNVDYDGYLNSVNRFLDKFKEELTEEEEEISTEDLL